MTEVQTEEAVLDVKNLQTVFFTNSGLFRAVDDVSFTVTLLRAPSCASALVNPWMPDLAAA